MPRRFSRYIDRNEILETPGLAKALLAFEDHPDTSALEAIDPELVFPDGNPRVIIYMYPSASFGYVRVPTLCKVITGWNMPFVRKVDAEQAATRLGGGMFFAYFVVSITPFVSPLSDDDFAELEGLVALYTMQYTNRDYDARTHGHLDFVAKYA